MVKVLHGTINTNNETTTFPHYFQTLHLAYTLTVGWLKDERRYSYVSCCRCLLMDTFTPI